MPLQIRCPNNHLLHIAETLLGKKVRCPKCQAVMMVGAAPSVSPDAVTTSPQHASTSTAAAPPRPAVESDDELEEPKFDGDAEDAPRIAKKHGGMKKAKRMRLTRLGLLLHSATIICLLVAGICVFVNDIATVIANAGGDLRNRPAQVSGALAIFMRVLSIFAMVLFFLTPLLATVGSLLCLWVPSKTKAKGLIISSFALDCVSFLTFTGSLVVLLVGSLLARPGRPGGMSELMGILWLFGWAFSVVMLVAAWFLFMLFLRALYRYFDDRNGVRDAQRLLFYNIALILGTPVYFFVGILVLGLLAGKGHTVLAQAMIGVLAVAWLLACIQHLMKLHNLIAGVRAYLGQWE